MTIKREDVIKYIEHMIEYYRRKLLEKEKYKLDFFEWLTVEQYNKNIRTLQKVLSMIVEVPEME